MFVLETVQKATKTILKKIPVTFLKSFIRVSSTKLSLSPARWHDKHTYLSSLGILGTTRLNSIFLQIT